MAILSDIDGDGYSMSKFAMRKYFNRYMYTVIFAFSFVLIFKCVMITGLFPF